MITTKDTPTARPGRGRPRRSQRFQEASENGTVDQFLGDRDDLVERFTRLAHKLAQKMYGASFVRRLGDLDDVRQEALLGLIRAAECYDPDHTSAAKAMTYLYTSVTRWLYREGQSAGMIRIPSHIPITDWDDHPTAHVGFLGELQISLLPDHRSGPSDAGPDTVRLHQMVDLLCDPDRSMVVLYYGLGGRPPTPMKEIAKRYRVSKQSVWNCIRRAIRTMRREWEEREEGVVPPHQGEFAFAREGGGR